MIKKFNLAGIKVLAILILCVLAGFGIFCCHTTEDSKAPGGPTGPSEGDGNINYEVASITVSANPSTISPDGISQSEITAYLKTSYGAAVPDNTSVTFETTLGSLNPVSSGTINGVAKSVLISSTEVATATVTARSGGVYGQATVQFAHIIESISLAANPQTIEADGVSKSEITAYVRTIYGTPAPEHTVVTFETTLGEINPTMGWTITGVATSYLISSTERATATVTAWSGDKSGTVDVKFDNIPGYDGSLTIDPDNFCPGPSTNITVTLLDQDLKNEVQHEVTIASSCDSKTMILEGSGGYFTGSIDITYCGSDLDAFEINWTGGDTITVTYFDEKAKDGNSAVRTVNSTVKSLSLSSPSLTIKKGDYGYFCVSCFDTYIWESSDESVATVTPSGNCGNVYGVDIGTCQIFVYGDINHDNENEAILSGTVTVIPATSAAVIWPH